LVVTEIKIIYVISKSNVIYTGTELWQLSWIDIIIKGYGIQNCMIVNWNMNFLCICHCSMMNVRYNKAEECICMLVYARKWLFIIFCIWLPFTSIEVFFFCFVLTICSWISKKICSNKWTLYLCIYLGILYDFPIKTVNVFFRAIIHNISTKKAVSTTKKRFYFPRF